MNLKHDDAHSCRGCSEEVASGQMREVELGDKAGALGAFACARGVSERTRRDQRRGVPAPGPPRTKMTVTLELSKWGMVDDSQKMLGEISSICAES